MNKFQNDNNVLAAQNAAFQAKAAYNNWKEQNQ